jgi:hypothetical protein
MLSYCMIASRNKKMKLNLMNERYLVLKWDQPTSRYTLQKTCERVKK